MFRRILKWTLRILALLVIALAIFLINLIWFRPWSLNLFYEKVFAQVLFEEPELLSSLGLVERFGITGHNGKLGDVSPAHQQRYFDRARKNLEDLHAYPLEKQNPSQQLSTHILEWYMSREIEGEKYQFHNYPVNQLFGVQNEFPSFMANTHRLLAPRDCEYYQQRLNAVGTKFDQLLESLKLREQKGILPPRFVVEKVLVEMNNFVTQPPPENILATSFKTRTAKIDGMPDEQRATFQKKIETAITDRVYPAYHKLIDYFTALLPKTTTEDGAWKLPDGDAFYAYALRKSTTTTLKPEEVHDLGLREVARIEAEMRTLLDTNGYAGRPIGEAMDALRKDPRFLFSNDDKGRADALAEYTRLIDDAIERCRLLFATVPKAKIEVQRVPVFKEATAPGAYYNGASMDRTRPGTFYANLRDMNELPKWGMRTLAYHEGVPGHHWQIATAQELKGLPQFRKLIPFTAYQEGWALYTEWLAKEAGWYDGDPFGDLGRLQAELFRAVRLVVDTGIHSKRWPREQAITYMREKTGMGEKEVTAEIERYIVNPGQACAYKVGMLKIQELRKRAQAELGTKFDQRQFHDVVLKNGALPLEILEEQVVAYIQKTK
ncbi:MAG: DUF885 domain-containing protein [Verrucomicrobia bacterium]|nr:MAG: DUF885 domain-containing protein [Verrucomicrobiota bacterium]